MCVCEGVGSGEKRRGVEEADKDLAKTTRKRTRKRRRGRRACGSLDYWHHNTSMGTFHCQLVHVLVRACNVVCIVNVRACACARAVKTFKFTGLAALLMQYLRMCL